VGANAIDVYGHAAMMAGAPGGGPPGKAFTAMACEGMRIIIACGLEKLIPGNIIDLIKKTGRKSTDVSYGMSVGLIPIFGDLITEQEALGLLGDVEVTVIGRGGLDDGPSALTMLMDGEPDEIKKVLTVIDRVRGARVSGLPESMVECEPGPSCTSDHLACVHRNPKLLA